MPAILASLVCGLIFGWGLLISEMVQPAKVLAFLDIFGDWDPSLAFTMGAALIVSSAGFALARRRERPLLAPRTFWPSASTIDRPLVIGAAMFGVGWGLSGLCPGPALENLSTLNPRLLVFVAAMIAGMLLQMWWHRRQAAQARREAGEGFAPADG